MTNPANKLARFWKELVRRKVLPFLIAYIAACFAIIEFFDIMSKRFTIPDRTFDLLYILAAAGLPVVITLPWFINRKKEEKELPVELKPPAEDEKKPMHNLPSQLTNFIGREKEMQTVKELINEHRLVTLTGAGGCGKTRLACEVAARLVPDYRDGVWFVDLSPITDGELVTKEVMEVMEIKEEPNQQITDTLIDHIKDKNLIIILDNCEHLIQACATIARKLLESVPGLKILATSREALCITGEKIWRVPSLTLIEPKTIINIEQAKNSEAVLLFTDRAKLNNPEFKLESDNVHEVVAICNKLDGMPLAVELVASRTRHMKTQTILEKFSDRFDQLPSSDPGVSMRQKTLQATIEWSYNLLSETERILFARLAVFSGGFDLEAAEDVCSDDQLAKDEILDLLSKLVDRSLVYTTKESVQVTRYKLLETLRQFAQQKLTLQKEEEVLKKRHLKYYSKISKLAFEEQTESQLKWLNKLEQEHDNIIAALNWAFNNSLEDFIMLSGTLAWFWRSQSHLILGEDYLVKAMDKHGSESEAYARVLCGLGIILWVKDAARGIEVMNESLEIYSKYKNQFEEAIATKELSMLHNINGDYEKGTKYSKKSLEIARKIGKHGLINDCLGYVSFSLISLKKFGEAKPLVEEYLVSAERLKQPRSIFEAHHLRGDCALGLKDFKEGEKKYGLAIETSLRYGNVFQAGIDMQGVAFSVSGQSRFAKSIRLDAASRKKCIEFGVTMDGKAEFWDEFIEVYINGAKKKVGEELTRKYEEEGRAMSFDQAVEYALDFKKD